MDFFIYWMCDMVMIVDMVDFVVRKRNKNKV